VGIASDAECVDFETREAWPAELFLLRIAAAAPAGLSFTGLRPLDASEGALQETVRRGSYLVTLDGAAEARDLLEAWDRTRREGRLVVRRERKGREEEITLDPATIGFDAADARTLRISLPLGGSGTVRPTDLLAALGAGRVPLSAILREGIFGAGADGESEPLAEALQRPGAVPVPLPFALPSAKGDPLQPR
jgi:radical SAM-linked protein